MIPIIISVITLIALPAVFIFLLWRANFNSKLEWILDAAVTILLISWITQSGNWGWISYYLRFLWPILLLASLYVSWKKTRHLPMKIKFTDNQKITVGVYIVLILIFGFYNIGTIKSYTVNEEAIELTFPLKNGTYYVGQGGNHAQMNYHQVAPPQKYALDIVKINTFGARAKGLYPKSLEKYYIYGDELLSPCTGEIVEVRNDATDFTPPEMDDVYAEGNYVEIICDEYDAHIYMAHMQKGSITVQKGDRVEVEQLIGLVGNSGNTTEPHLHIHAEHNGEGVPITFDGKFLVRNSLVK